MKQKILVTLCGPSCSGKSTLEKMLVNHGFGQVISSTTRTPRAGEVDGVNYHFIDRATFDRMKAAGEFAETVEYSGGCYGATVAEFEAIFNRGAPAVFVCEPHGRNQIAEFSRANGWTHIPVYIGNSVDLILERFFDRVRADVISAMAAGGSAKAGEVMERASARLKSMIDIEYAEWIREAKLPPESNPYALVLEKFSSRDQSDLDALMQIRAMVEAAELAAHPRDKRWVWR